MHRKIILFIIFISISIGNIAASRPEVIKGKIDLCNFNFKNEGIVKLNGEWKFYEGALIKTYPNSKINYNGYIKVPSAWNKHAKYGKIKNGIGVGTYCILIKKNKNDHLTLLMRDIGSSYKVWLNNKLQMEVGHVDTLALGCVPSHEKASIKLVEDTTTFELVIEVANFSQNKGGVKSFVSLIRSNQNVLQHERESLRNYFCLGIIIIMGFYHLFLFFLNHKDKASFNFGLFCFDISLFLLFRSRIIYYFISDFDWDLGNKIEYIAQYLSLPLFYIFFSSSFPKQFKNLYRNTSVVLSLLLIVYVLFTDTIHFSQTLEIFHIILIIYIILVLIGSVRTLIAKEPGIKIIFTGLVIFMICLINDILHVQNIINTDNFIIYGILGFIICQALFLADKSVANYHKITSLSVNLSKLNKSLEIFVPSDFLKLLNKKSITEVGLGNNVEMELTIMFSDIRAFTTISEKLSPNESFNFINNYLQCMAPIIRHHNGFIDKYLGDGLMALFPHKADDALLAGKAMLDELVKFNLKNEKLGMPHIEIGIGLHTGSCILGTVGEHKRMDTTVIADSVNLAARIEALTKFYRTPFIISDETHNQTSHELRANMRFIGEAQVKGKFIKTRLYKVFLDHKYHAKLLDKFDLGITYFYDKKFKEASEIFHQLNGTEVADGILDFYIQLSDKYMNQELPDDWQTFQTFEY